MTTIFDVVRAEREAAAANDRTYGARVQSLVDRAMTSFDASRSTALQEQEDRKADREARAVANANAVRARIAFWGV